MKEVRAQDAMKELQQATANSLSPRMRKAFLKRQVSTEQLLKRMQAFNVRNELLSNLKLLFAQADEDGNGYITIDDFTKHFKGESHQSNCMHIGDGTFCTQHTMHTCSRGLGLAAACSHVACC